MAAVAFSKNLAAGLSTARRVGSNPRAALNEVAVTLAPTSKLAVNGSNGTSDSLVSVWSTTSVANDSDRRWATPWLKATTGSIIRAAPHS